MTEQSTTCPLKAHETLNVSNTCVRREAWHDWAHTQQRGRHITYLRLYYK